MKMAGHLKRKTGKVPEQDALDISKPLPVYTRIKSKAETDYLLFITTNYLYQQLPFHPFYISNSPFVLAFSPLEMKCFEYVFIFSSLTLDLKTTQTNHFAINMLK